MSKKRIRIFSFCGCTTTWLPESIFGWLPLVCLVLVVLFFLPCPAWFCLLLWLPRLGLVFRRCASPVLVVGCLLPGWACLALGWLGAPRLGLAGFGRRGGFQALNCMQHCGSLAQWPCTVWPRLGPFSSFFGRWGPLLKPKSVMDQFLLAREVHETGFSHYSPHAG